MINNMLAIGGEIFLEWDRSKVELAVPPISKTAYAIAIAVTQKNPEVIASTFRHSATTTTNTNRPTKIARDLDLS